MFNIFSILGCLIFLKGLASFVILEGFFSKLLAKLDIHKVTQ